MGVEDADSHKLGLHPHKVSRWMTGEDVPFHAEIGITNRCNHHCSFCTLDWVTHGNNDINYSTLCKTLEELEYMGVESIYLAGEGEPTLHPDFTEIVAYCGEIGMKVAVATNGQRFTQDVAKSTLKRISWIRFSLDTVDIELYKKIHGVSADALHRVLNNIRDAVKIKKEQNLPVAM